MDISILLEDEYLIAVHKPAGIPCAVDLPLLKTLSQREPLHPIHRLDQRVSGVWLLAKTGDIQTQMSALWSSGLVQKKYHAVVAVAPTPASGSLQHWLVQNQANKKVKAYPKPVAHSKQANLDYTLLKSSQRYHLLEVLLKTGRFHQIRAQFAAIGSPIVGDVKYGYARTTPDGSIFLQASSLVVPHPHTKKQIEITVPIPVLWQKYGL
ncbi:MAG: RluA family pseudouridine synthase [Chitinophagaceae bacterium]